MRFIKLAGISIILLFLVMTAISALLPSIIHLSRAIDINAPFDTVYSTINDVSRWKNWYADYDTSQAAVSAKTTGKGASVTMYKTTVTITETSADKIEAVWHSGNNTPLEGEFNMIKQDSALLTTVQWKLVHHVKWYPWAKFASILSDKAAGPVMEKSLDNLKAMLEKPVDY